MIGPIGKDLAINDLAWWDGRLFAIDSNYPDGANLIEINPDTGAMISSVPVTIDGELAINGIESIAADATGLIVGIWNGGSNPAISDNLGRLGLDGAVTDLQSFGTDLDGLSITSDGSLISLDRDPLGPHICPAHLLL